MKSIFFAVVSLFFLYSNASHAYFVQVSGQSLTNQDSNRDNYNQFIPDGVTSVAYDTGVLTSLLDGAQAQSKTAADLATGTLKVFAEVNQGAVTGFQVVQAAARFGDEVMFDLPNGVSEAEVSFYLTVEGVLIGQVSGASVSSISLSFNGRFGTSSDEVLLVDAVLPEMLKTTLFVKEGELYNVGASVFASTLTSDYALIDLGNTAFLSIEMPEGTTFSSASGVLLTSPVPIPAAAWLFGSALAGLAAIGRNRKRLL